MNAVWVRPHHAMPMFAPVHPSSHRHHLDVRLGRDRLGSHAQHTHHREQRQAEIVLAQIVWHPVGDLDIEGPRQPRQHRVDHQRYVAASLQLGQEAHRHDGVTKAHLMIHQKAYPFFAAPQRQSVDAVDVIANRTEAAPVKQPPRRLVFLEALRIVA